MRRMQNTSIGVREGRKETEAFELLPWSHPMNIDSGGVTGPALKPKIGISSALSRLMEICGLSNWLVVHKRCLSPETGLKNCLKAPSNLPA